MSSFNESVALGYLKQEATEFVKYPLPKADVLGDYYYMHFKILVHMYMHWCIRSYIHTLPASQVHALNDAVEFRTFLPDFPSDFDEQSCVNKSWTDEKFL